MVYASSFSKTVCPGIRVGYLAGPEGLIKDIRKMATETYISPSMVSQSIVAEFCTLGRDRDVDRDRQGGAAASAATAPPRRWSATSATTPASSSPRAATSCGSTCPTAPTGPPSTRRARERGVVFVKGTDFLLEGGDSSLRIAYSGVTPDEIDEGVSRLAEAYRELAGARA